MRCHPPQATGRPVELSIVPRTGFCFWPATELLPGTVAHARRVPLFLPTGRQPFDPAADRRLCPAELRCASVLEDSQAKKLADVERVQIPEVLEDLEADAVPSALLGQYSRDRQALILRAMTTYRLRAAVVVAQTLRLCLVRHLGARPAYHFYSRGLDDTCNAQQPEGGHLIVIDPRRHIGKCRVARKPPLKANECGAFVSQGFVDNQRAVAPMN